MNSVVSIDRPVGFLDAKAFQGFEQPSTGASVAVTGMSVPLSDFVAGLTVEALGKQGVQLLDKETMASASGPRLLLHVRQSIGVVIVEKWIAVLGTDTRVVLVAASWPESLSDQLSDLMKEVVLSASWNPDASIADANPGGSMPGLQFATQLGDMAIYTRDGRYPVTNSQSPLFVAGYSNVNPPVKAGAAFAKDRISRIPGIEEVRIEQNTRVVVDELHGYETVARGRSSEAQALLFLYQLILFDSDRYFLAQGIVCESERSAYLPRFQHLAKQFRRIRSTKSEYPVSLTDQRTRRFDPFSGS